MRIHLGGHLSWYDNDKRSWLELAQPEALSLRELAARLGVPAGEVAIVTVNRRLVDLDGPPVSDSDVIEFFPPMGGG